MSARMEDRTAIWRVVEKHTCPDCFHAECLAIGDAATALINVIEGAAK